MAKFIILETLFILSNSLKSITQVLLSQSSGVDISVVSTVLKNLRKKSYINRKTGLDNRNKIIELTPEAISLLKKILPIVNKAEMFFFSKLGKEEINFCNFLRLILGRKIRIKAERI